MNTTTDTTRVTCPTCDGLRVVRSYAIGPEAACDMEECPDCEDGSIEVDAGDPAEMSDTPHGLCDDDGEPPDIDSDAGYDPYTGGAEDDGYDTGTFDDGPCDDC